MTRAVLVTGAGGFVGRHLVRALEALGCAVSTHTRADGDLATRAPAVRPVTHVVHLAGRTFVPESWSDPAAFYRDNAAATANVAAYCRHTGAALVHVSSYVYGTPERLPVDETHPLDAENPYGHSKILGEEIVRFFCDRRGARATILRPFNLYGPGQDDRFLIPSMLRQAVDPASDAITIRDAEPKRDFLHVSDFVALLVAALEAEPGGVYNAGSGRSTGIGELAAIIGDVSGSQKPLRATGERRPHEIPDVVADISRAAKAFGWRPRIDLRAGLADTAVWMRERQVAPA